MTILLFISGLSLSSISTVYAVIGLLSIFPAAPTTIVIMGTALEVSKLVIASWLYRNWVDIPRFLKMYFSVAMIVLMFLTSMSIFGYLSKAHMDSAVVTGDATASLQIIDEKIATQKENVLQSKKALSQMDAQVNEMLSRTTDAAGTSKAIRIRVAQKPERSSLNVEISTAQSIISKLQSERAPLAVSVRKIEAEVGPIRYIANLIYGDNIDETMLDKAVRIVILMIVFVFDPLAVLLLIAANWNMKYVRGNKIVEIEHAKDTIEINIDPKDYEPIKLNPIPPEKIDAYRKKLDNDRKSRETTYEGSERDSTPKSHQSAHYDNNESYDSSNSSLVAAAAAIMDKSPSERNKQLFDACLSIVDKPLLSEELSLESQVADSINNYSEENHHDDQSQTDEASKVVKQFFAPLHLTENEGDSHEKAFSDLLYDEEKTATDRDVHVSDADKSTSQAVSISSVATVSDEQPLVHIK